MIKIKQFIKNNWMMTLIYTLGFAGAVIIGWLLGRPSMLHATAFSGSSITYNENQQLEYTLGSGWSAYNCTGEIHTYSTTYTANTVCSSIGTYTSYIYVNGTLNNNVITFPKMYYQSANATLSTNTNASTFTINSNSVTIYSAYHGYSGTATPIQTGYTEQQYLEYGTQQYNAGYSAGVAYVQNHPAEYNLYTAAQYSANYTAGQNAVINSPNTYNLYTQAQYNANYTTGYNAGVVYVQNHPSEYNLYTSAQYTAYGTAQYTAGQNAVLNNPNSYNLYTSAQYNAYGNSQYTAGETAVQNDPHTYGLYTSTDMTNNYNAGIQYVLDHPAEYNLYTSAQYNANAEAQYNAGYLAGQQASTNYQDGIQYVLDHPAEYDLYTESQYTAYGTAQYTAGQNSVINDPNTYDLYNQAQYEAYAQQQYNDGYSAGVDSYSYETIVPTFTGSFYYACTNNASPGGWCESANTISDLSTINFSNYANYTTNVAYPESMGNLINSGYNIEQSNYYVLMSTIQSGASVIAIPEFVTDIYIQFCESYSSYYILGTEYNYCKSIATNVPNYSPSGAVYGIDDVFNNPGIYVGNIDRIENGYRILELNNYLVGSAKNWRFIQVLLGNDSTIQTQYSNFSLTYVSSPLDAEAYNYGYQQGYSSGNAVGSATAQKVYYAKGYDDGFNKARVVGDSSLVGVTGTILSTPVNMFKSMFNVEFLGVNLAGFILSIVTLFIAIWLIKKFL